MPIVISETVHFQLAPGPAYITGLASTSGTSYFIDSNGQPKLLICENPWALPAQAGRWSSGNADSEFDSYLTTRANQGYTGVYVTPYGNSVNGCTFTNGRNFQGDYPFSSGSTNDPSSGLNNTFWSHIDHFLTKAQSLGITVLLNIGYDESAGGGDMNTGGCLNGKTGTQYTDYGTNLGNRYKTFPNLIWIVGNDYFAEWDSAYASMLTGLRNSGDTHLIAIHNFPESTSRFDLFDSTAAAWGTSHSQFNFCYTYDCEYLAAEYAYAETSPLTVFQGDGYFYQGTTGSYDATYDRAARQDLWWSLASGARGHNTGDEGIWQWPTGAQNQASTGWFYANNVGHIRAAVEALPGWHTLLPATGTSLITAGRGTRATQIVSGGSGTQYEPATTNAYVAASLAPDGGSGSTLALMYLPKATTITIDQTKMVASYTATWIDPITGATSSATPGSTYNSTAKGNNSQGDPDWALALKGP